MPRAAIARSRSSIRARGSLRGPPPLPELAHSHAPAPRPAPPHRAPAANCAALFAQRLTDAGCQQTVVFYQQHLHVMSCQFLGLICNII